jgi:hypothetical protein
MPVRWPLRRQMLVPMLAIMGVTLGLVSLLEAWLATACRIAEDHQGTLRFVRVSGRTCFILELNTCETLPPGVNLPPQRSLIQRNLEAGRGTV